MMNDILKFAFLGVLIALAKDKLVNRLILM